MTSVCASPAGRALAAAFMLCLAGCRASSSPDYFLNGAGEERETLKELRRLLDAENLSETERFALVRETANIYRRQNNYAVLINFLSEWTLENPHDQFNGYYLLMIAYSYMRQNSPDVAALYFNMIVKNYPDLIVKGESVHLECLRQLLSLVDDPTEKIWYYEELLGRFQNDIDPGAYWFMLGQTRERTGEWDKAIAAYTHVIPYYGTVIAGFPDAYAYAKQMVDFNTSAKNWTFASLPALLNAIKLALDEGNNARLWQYRARVNFFSRSWAQSAGDDAGSAELNLPSFGGGARISYAPAFSPGSNANEAYLRTWGWPQFTSIWYFYFRKINFPPDPQIHGRWEWAGVYYGERF